MARAAGGSPVARGVGAGRAMLLTIAVAWLAVLGSAWAAVWARHEAREEFRSLQVLKQQRDELDIEWSQLRLELGTLAMHSRVEQLARERLSMRAPAADEIMTVIDDE